MQIDWEWTEAPQPKKRKEGGQVPWGEGQKGVLEALYSLLCGSNW